LEGAVTKREPHRAHAHSEHDRELLHGISRGEERAFEELYRSYHPRLVRFLSNLTRRPQLVEEVLNDTMIAVWEKPDSFRGASKVSTWVFAIAYRKAMKALRRLDEPVEDTSRNAVPSDDPGPDQNLWHVERTRLILAAMQDLSADQRTSVDLTYFHEMSYREIAEIMHCPVDTVKTRMFHARRRLKRLMAGEPADWMD
jgi:RNA polymerase sigma factor (sigma-70 family)